MIADPTTGATLGKPSKPGEYTAELYGEDGTGARALVKSWEIEVVDRPAFAVLNFTHLEPENVCGTPSTGQGSSQRSHDRDDKAQHAYTAAAVSAKVCSSTVETTLRPAERAQLPFAVGDVIRFAGVRLTKLTGVTNASDCMFTLGEGAPKGFFINPTTAEILGFLPLDVRNYSIAVLAVDPRGEKATVLNFTMHVMKTDVMAARNGPNNRGCAHGIVEDDDTFDGTFQCNCEDTRFKGPNCETEKQAWLWVMVVFATITALLVCAIVRRYVLQRYQQNLPHDFTAEMQNLLQEGDIVSLNTAQVPTEIKRRHVHLVEEIGSGEFGKVYKAKLDAGFTNVPGGVVVAAKVLNLDHTGDTESSLTQLYNEAAVMASETHVIT